MTHHIKNYRTLWIYGISVLLVALIGIFLSWKNSEPIETKTDPIEAFQENIIFTHPIFGYRLELPYAWKGNVSVSEKGMGTIFSIRSSEKEDFTPAFSVTAIRAQQQKNPNAIGGYFGLEYLFSDMQQKNKDEGEENQISNEVERIPSSFKREVDPENFMIKTFLYEHAVPRKEDEIGFITYSILGEEQVSENEYIKYLWIYTKTYTSGNTSVATQSFPFKIRFIKHSHYDYEIKETAFSNIKTLSAAELENIFPQNILADPMFNVTSDYYEQKTNNFEKRIGDQRERYFLFR